MFHSYTTVLPGLRAPFGAFQYIMRLLPCPSPEAPSAQSFLISFSELFSPGNESARPGGRAGRGKRTERNENCTGRWHGSLSRSWVRRGVGRKEMLTSPEEMTGGRLLFALERKGPESWAGRQWSRYFLTLGESILGR